MPTIKRRTRPSSDAPVERKRDRVRDEEATDDDDDDVEDDEAPRRPARKDPAARSVRHSSNQDREQNDDDEGDDEDRPRSRFRRPARDDDDDNDEEEKPRRKSRADVPEGVRRGWDGAKATAAAGGDASGIAWLRIGDHVELVKFLEDAPLTSFRQHWLESGEGKSRPHLCPGSKCPLCGQGNQPAAYYLFNVLYLSGGAIPEVRVLQVNQSAYKNLVEVFADRKTGDPAIDVEGLYASVKKTGKGFQTRTTFAKVKERDLKEDWDEIFEYFDFKDLPDMIDEALEELYTIEEVSPKPTPRRELEKLAKYLDEPDED